MVCVHVCVLGGLRGVAMKRKDKKEGGSGGVSGRV